MDRKRLWKHFFIRFFDGPIEANNIVKQSININSWILNVFKNLSKLSFSRLLLGGIFKNYQVGLLISKLNRYKSYQWDFFNIFYWSFMAYELS